MVVKFMKEKVLSWYYFVSRDRYHSLSVSTICLLVGFFLCNQIASLVVKETREG